LADNKGWKAALQIVGNGDKMMEKYKDRIPVFNKPWLESPFSRWKYGSKSSQKVTLTEGVRGRKERSIPFVVGENMVGQDAKDRLHVSTVEESVILPQTVPPQVQRPLVNLKMMIDYAQAPSKEQVKSMESVDTLVQASGDFRCSGTMEESKLAVPSSKSRLVSMLLARAQILRKNSVSQNWNQHLDRAWCLYDNYCKVMGLKALPSKVDTLVSFIVWLDLTHAFSNCTDVLAAVSREHLEA
ncbi:14449_t:CDS:2, partial [Cetraspora pellucida]